MPKILTIEKIAKQIQISPIISNFNNGAADGDLRFRRVVFGFAATAFFVDLVLRGFRCANPVHLLCLRRATPQFPLRSHIFFFAIVFGFIIDFIFERVWQVLLFDIPIRVIVHVFIALAMP